MKSLQDILKGITTSLKSCFGAGASKETEAETPSTPEDESRATPPQHHSGPMRRVDPPAGADEAHIQQVNQKHDTLYTVNWSGALASNPKNQRFKSAYGTFVVPHPDKGAGSAGQWAAAAWVGIDGADYNQAILQAGVDFFVDANGKRSYSSWYEWYPAGSGEFPTFRPQPGHKVTISITSSSPSKGKVTLKNHTTGHKVSKSLRAPSKAGELRGQNAEWIVEDFMIGDSMVPLVDFNTVKFVDAHARTGRRKRIGLGDAKIINMISESDNSNILTDVNIIDKHSTGIKYTG